MNELNENPAVNGLRITYAVIATILIMIFTSNVAMWGTIMNKNFWHNFFSAEEVKELAMEELDISLESALRESHPGIDFDFDDEEVTGEFIGLLFEDYINLVIDDEGEFDGDKYHDFFDEYGDDLFGNTGMSRSEIRELEDEVVDGLEEKFDDARTEFRKSEDGDFIGQYNAFIDKNMICMGVTGALILIGFVVLLVIHKNKFRPIRALGISMTIAEGINLALWGVLLALIAIVMEESRTGEAIIDLMIKKIQGYSIGILVGIIAALILGIVLIVVGAVGAKNHQRLVEDSDNWQE